MVALTVARLASVAAVFLAGVVAARLLEPSALGVAAVGLTVAWAVAIVANGGLNIVAIYYLGRRPYARGHVVAYVLALTVGAVLAGLLLTGAAAPVVGAVVLGEQAPILFAAAALLAVATIGYEVAGALLLGLERRRGYVLADVLRSAATLGLTVLLLALVVRTAEGYVLAAALGVVVPAVVALVVVRRTVGSLRPRFDAGFSRAALRLGLSGQPGNVLTFLSLRLDLLLVPALLRLDLAGIYFVATRVADVVGQASTAAASMLFPHVAGQQDRRATAVTERTTRLTLLATLGAALVLACGASLLLRMVFGPAYEQGTRALLILLLGMVPLALTRVLAADLKGRGRPGLVSVGGGVGAGLTVIADLLLIPVWGIEGAAVASVLAYTGTAVVLLACYRKVTCGPLRLLVPRPGDLADLAPMVGWRLRPGRSLRDRTGAGGAL
jgi:stage V sporulation protein B